MNPRRGILSDQKKEEPERVPLLHGLNKDLFRRDRGCGGSFEADGVA